MAKQLRAFFDSIAAWDWLPVVCFVVFPALAVRGKWLIVAADATGLWGDYSLGDIRTWWKGVFVVGIAIWMLCMSVCRGKKIWRGNWRFPGVILAGAAGMLAATWLSPFPYTRWAGYTALYEGAFCFLAYLAAVWYTGGVERGEARLRIVRSVLVVAAVNIVLGIMSGMYRNFWQTGLGIWIIGIPESMIRFNFAGTNMASGTAYQPNHYGMLMAMIGALALGMTFAEKARTWKYIWGGAYVFSCVALLFSQSRAGIAVLGALSVGTLAAKAFTAKNLKFSAKKIALAAAVCAGVVAAGYALGFGGTVERILARTAALTLYEPQDNEITDVGLADNVITVKARSGTLEIGRLSASTWYAAFDGGRRSALQFADGPAAKNGDIWRVAQLPGIPKAVLRVNQRNNVLLVCPPRVNMEFFAPGEELFAVDQTPTNLRLRGEVPLSAYAAGGYERAVSGRGYIWMRSLEKWRERPLFGWGPGSLPLVFPNDELLNKKYFSGNEDEDKGHSLYVTFLVQAGIVGTMLYFLPFGYAAYALLRSGGAPLRLPLLLAMAAYAACGLTNDSTNGVTPLFCVFAGLAYAEGKCRERDNSYVRT